MELFQLLDCSGNLGTCCKDYSLVAILAITKNILNIIQFVVPIILIIAGTIQFVQLTVNPELKDGFRKVLNKLIAAIIIFLLPLLVDVILSTTSSNFSVASCWKQSNVISSENVFSKGSYVNTPDEENSVWMDPITFSMAVNLGDDDSDSGYGDGTGSHSSGGESSSSGTGSAKGRAIVEYASQFVGEEYEWGGYWDGEIPYTPTDCSGFVTAIFRHFGIDLPRGLNMFGYDTSLYDEVSESEMQAGDVIMYDGHVGIYTGVGKEMIHAASTNLGVIKSSDYSMCSSHAILGFLRIKGV